MKDFISGLSGVVCFLGSFPYCLAIIRRQTKPIRASWLIFSALNSTIFVSMLLAKSLNWQIVGSLVGCYTITVLAILRGLPGWSRLDKFCLAGAALSLALMGITGSPLVGMIAGLTADSLGCIPTFVSAYADPKRENGLAWFLAFVSSVLALFGLTAWTVATAAQPLTFLVLQFAMVSLVIVRPWWKSIRI